MTKGCTIKIASIIKRAAVRNDGCSAGHDLLQPGEGFGVVVTMACAGLPVGPGSRSAICAKIPDTLWIRECSGFVQAIVGQSLGLEVDRVLQPENEACAPFGQVRRPMDIS